MNFVQRIRQWRGWFPVPKPSGRVDMIRWILLEANRLAVASALLTSVYVSLMLIGTIWTFEMQQILTETSTVENILLAFLSGIILLVSIVVSINAIVLSQDIASIGAQEDRIRSVMEFRNDIGDLTDSSEAPSNPATFLQIMATVISRRAQTLTDETEGMNEESVDEIQTYADSVTDTIDQFENLKDHHGSQFAVLWMALELDYGPHLVRSRVVRTSHGETLYESNEERFDSLVESLQLFAIGREYFKTLYYIKEVSRLSRVLLIVSLPAVLITATAILAIGAQVLPRVWVFGLPPLQSFVATTFTIALIPYIVLTAYMLRLSTVAMRTATGGLFSLQ